MFFLLFVFSPLHNIFYRLQRHKRLLFDKLGNLIIELRLHILYINLGRCYILRESVLCSNAKNTEYHVASCGLNNTEVRRWEIESAVRVATGVVGREAAENFRISKSCFVIMNSLESVCSVYK